jgi:hypothetical protein
MELALALALAFLHFLTVYCIQFFSQNDLGGISTGFELLLPLRYRLTRRNPNRK